MGISEHLKAWYMLGMFEQVQSLRWWLVKDYNIIVSNEEVFPFPIQTVDNLIISVIGIRKCDINDIGRSGRMAVVTHRFEAKTKCPAELHKRTFLIYSYFLKTFDRPNCCFLWWRKCWLCCCCFMNKTIESIFSKCNISLWGFIFQKSPRILVWNIS